MEHHEQRNGVSAFVILAGRCLVKRPGRRPEEVLKGVKIGVNLANVSTVMD